MEENLSIIITHYDNGLFRISQPRLIERIVSSIPSMIDARIATIPASAGVMLTKKNNVEIRKEHWNYTVVIGILRCLVNCTHPEMVYIAHQCARFCNYPKYTHEQAMKTIIRYLIGTTRNYNTKKEATQGIIFKPDKTRSIDT